MSFSGRGSIILPCRLCVLGFGAPCVTVLSTCCCFRWIRLDVVSREIQPQLFWSFLTLSRMQASWIIIWMYLWISLRLKHCVDINRAHQAPVVQRVDSVGHWMSCYPVDEICRTNAI